MEWKAGVVEKTRARVNESRDAFRELVIFLSGAGISVRHWQMWDNLNAARPVTNPDWDAQSQPSKGLTGGIAGQGCIHFEVNDRTQTRPVAHRTFARRGSASRL